jgi:hypothetical protein
MGVVAATAAAARHKREETPLQESLKYPMQL